MSQRMRKNVSPSTKQGPIKAVKAFSLKHNTLSASSTSRSSSPTVRSDRFRTRNSPDSRLSPERKSPISPCQKEKAKCHRSPVLLLPCRPSSVDQFVPYLTGQWPKDINSYHHYQSGGVFMCDKSTQTVEDSENTCSTEKKKAKSHRRSASFGHGDLSKELIKQRLQKTKEGSRNSEFSKQRLSPIPGNHLALSVTAPAAFFSQTKTLIPPTAHIPRHSNMNRYQRNSVEGLNVEIEKLVLKPPSSAPDMEESEVFIKAHDIPDGHRAPIPEITRLSSTRSVDTQTPSAQVEEGRPHSAASRCDSLSPGVTGGLSLPCQSLDHLHVDSRPGSQDSKSSKGDSEYNQDSPEPSKFVSSPKLEKSCPFVRQPPDGCEKVKAKEENRHPSIKEPLLFCPVKPNQFVFKPSQGSAFCPLYKHYLGEGELTSNFRQPQVPLPVSTVPSLPSQGPGVESQ